MSSANTTPQLFRPGAKRLGLALVLAGLAAVVALAGWRELQKAAPAVQPQVAAHAFSEHPRPALSAAEERFSLALWNIHSEIRTAAVRMTFAGLTYKMGDADRASVGTKVVPLTAVFRKAESAVRALDAPVSMHALRGRYAGALQAYGDASLEMVKVVQDGKDAHLLKAQEISEQASGILLEVGEQLWPGEIKPN